MKYVSNPDFDVVSAALNYETPGLNVLGGCDLYTTKAAGKDKKLYKDIEHGLEAQHQSNLAFSMSLSPPQQSMMAASLNLSRSSPFGNLGTTSSRRIYAYLIAILNESHPDYDFTNMLRPRDFKREPSLRQVMNNVDTALYNLRKRPFNTFVAIPSLSPDMAYPINSLTSWGPGMWRLIDQQMSLKECIIYRYAPEEFDPFEDDEAGALWSMNYFFFNKHRKRVCYLYLRGVSSLADGGADTPIRTPLRGKRGIDDDEEEADEWPTSMLGASKRARHWLGSDRNMSEAETLVNPADATPEESFSPPARPVVDENDNYNLSDEEVGSTRSTRSRSKSFVRGTSEEIVGAMEV